MKEKDFNISLEFTKYILNKYGLLGNHDFYKKKISDEFIGISRDDDFFKLYIFAIQNLDYNFSLFDESLLQLQFDKQADTGLILRYAYYQFPYDFPTYKEYLIGRGLSFNEVGLTHKYEYEQALTEAPKKDYFLLIRYDYSEKEYSPCVHSVSHFHIGSCNTIRIPSSVVITPLLFVLFILKQVYYDEWKYLIETRIFKIAFKKSKNKCENINDIFFSDMDKSELYLK